jgi:hypothetical protein
MYQIELSTLEAREQHGHSILEGHKQKESETYSKKFNRMILIFIW